MYDFVLFPNMTVKKNILTVLPKDKRGRIDSIVSAFHLNGLEERFPSQLSGGQKQRCVLARMIVSESQNLCRCITDRLTGLDKKIFFYISKEAII